MTRTAPRRSIERDPFLEAYERRMGAAWAEYLDTTRDAPHHRYGDVEEAAWLRLHRRLQRIELRRKLQR